MRNIKVFIPALLVFIVLSGFTTQLFRTSLKINVRNELGNTENGVNVTLYNNSEDYSKEVNPVASEVTDKKGNVTFKDLEPKVYYINAEKGDMNNFGAGEKTDTLTENRLNKVTVIISE